MWLKTESGLCYIATQCDVDLVFINLYTIQLSLCSVGSQFDVVCGIQIIQNSILFVLHSNTAWCYITTQFNVVIRSTATQRDVVCVLELKN